MSFKRIKPLNAERINMSKPSLYRACVSGNPTEYAVVDAKIMMLYIKRNWKDGKNG